MTRPWVADDGALVRLRLVGGVLSTPALAALVRLSQEYGDGDLHLTKRANVQLRALPVALPQGFVDGVRDAGLLPSPAHDLVRNVMVSPLSGRVGGRADLHPAVAELDRLMLADAACAQLAGRFLFVLDDGRGDLVDRSADLAVVALDDATAQVRAGADQWGPVVALPEVAGTLLGLARRFVALRGDGSAWHVDELDVPLLTSSARDPRSDVGSGAPGFEDLVQDDGRRAEHVEVPQGRLTSEQAADVLARAGAQVLVTPWRSLLLPDLPQPDSDVR